MYRPPLLGIPYHFNIVVNLMTLEVDGIEFGYTSHNLLGGVYIKCPRGDVVGLLGRNGAGKSTLMKIVFGTIRPDTSSIRIDGKPIASPGFIKRLISYLPQDSFLPSGVRLRDICKYSEVSFESILEYFPEMSQDKDLFPGQLSGGRQRVFEAMLIILGKAPFCLLDEPFTGLSPLFVDRLKQVIVSMKSLKGIVVSDHLFRDVLEIADSVYVLTNGRTYQVSDEIGLAQRGYVA